MLNKLLSLLGVKKLYELLTLASLFVATATLSSRVSSVPLDLFVWLALLAVLLLVVSILKGDLQLSNYPLLKGGMMVASGMALLITVAKPVDNLEPFKLKAVLCAIPLAWSALFAAYFILGSFKSRVWAKIVATLATTFMGVSVVLVVWYMGSHIWVVKSPAIDRFPYTFGIWEREPFWKHLFLTFDMRWFQYEKGLSYHGYTNVYTIPHWLILKFIRWYAGIQYNVGIKLVPFVHGVFFALLLPGCMAWRMRLDLERRARFLALLFIPTGLIISTPDIWTGPMFFDGDNCFPLFACLIILCVTTLAKYEELPSRRATALVFSTHIFLAIFIPLLAVMYGAALVLFYCSGSRSRLFFYAGLSIVVCSVAAYGATGLTAKLGGFGYHGSSVLFRSGLDQGGAGSLGMAWRSLVSPQGQFQLREVSSMWLGLYSALAAIVLVLFGSKRDGSIQMIFPLFAPVIIDLAVFPQSHSIHPYLYDATAAVLGVMSLAWIIQSSDEGSEDRINAITPWALIFMLCALLGNFMALRTFFLRFAA
jgi:hypothetical protein